MNPKVQKPVLDPGAPAQASPPIVVVRKDFIRPIRTTSREKLPVRRTSLTARRFQPPDVPRPFLGWVPSTRPVSLGGKPPSYKEAPALPAPLTGWSGATRLVRRVIAPKSSSASNRGLPSPAGGDRSFRLAAPSCRCRPSGEAGTSVPITHEPCTMNPSRAKRKMRAQACG